MRYQIDFEALSGRARDHIGIIEDIVSALSDPNWSLDRTCRPCYEWDSGSRSVRPRPPRAFDATNGCAGCTWSYLDGIDAEELRLKERISRLQVLHSSWSAQLPAYKSQNLARYQAKKRELKACEKLIRNLTKRLEERGQTPHNRRRSKVLRSDCVNNVAAVAQPVTEVQVPAEVVEDCWRKLAQATKEKVTA